MLWRDSDDKLFHRLEDTPEGCSIGRSLRCNVVLSESTVSRRHALLSSVGGAWYVEDVGSTAGTYILRPSTGNRRVTGRMALKHGDLLILGGARMRYVDFPDPDLGASPTADETGTTELDRRGAGPALTAAERRVLQALCEPTFEGRGWALNAEIAEKLFSSPATVRTHLKSLYRKFHVNENLLAAQRRADLVRRAIDGGYVQPSSLPTEPFSVDELGPSRGA